MFQILEHQIGGDGEHLQRQVQTGIDISDAVKDVNNALVNSDKKLFYKDLRKAVP